MQKRYVLLDILRGLAVLLMLIFHLAVDLEDFFGYAVGYRQGFWYVLNQLIVIIFLLVAGYAAGRGLHKNILKSSLKLLTAALVVSAATYYFDSTSYVRFGILHLFACCMFLSPLLLRVSNSSLLLVSFAYILLGRYVQTLTAETPLFLPLGIRPQEFYSIDYYPLFPWLCLFIWGVIAGRRVKLPDKQYGCFALQPLAWLGRHALVIYLVHQPLFLLFLSSLLG